MVAIFVSFHFVSSLPFIVHTLFHVAPGATSFTSVGAGTNLERHLEVLPADLVPVHHTHRLYGTVHVEVLDESVALALASVAIRDDLHALDGTER